MSSYDEECPHCGADIDVYGVWAGNDPDSQFTFECPHCRKAVDCEVEFDPSFSLSRHCCDRCEKVLLEDEFFCVTCKAELKAAREAKGAT